MVFRKDVNGLRAIAVLAVMLFHFDNEYLNGGFAGVDVFFVISGFLMTKIILGGIEGGTFNLWGFYCARATRIVPALVSVCMVTLIIGWFFLIPMEFIGMGKDALSSIAFVSNFIYLFRAGYFDDSSTNNFLLHTWSLSVEWQFYIIYPIVLVFISRVFSFRAAKLSVFIMCAMSFVLALYGVYNFAEESYYMFPTRAWVMLVGGMVYLLPEPVRFKSHFQVVGFILVAYAFYIITKQTPWPGVMALFPAVGTAIIIYANTDSILFNNRASQTIGSISYEMYLIHWPLLIFFNKINLDISPIIYFMVTILLSYCLNVYCMVSKGKTIVNSAAFALVAIFSLLIISNDGYAERVPEQYRVTKEEFHKKYFGASNYPVNQVIYINSSRNDFKYIVAGDSFAAQYATSLDKFGVKTAALFDFYCLMFPSYSVYVNNQEDVNCSGEHEKLQQIMNDNEVAPLIFASSWNSYDGALIKKGAESPLPKRKDEYYSIVTSEILSVIKNGGSKRKYYVIGRPNGTNIDGFSCLAGSSLSGYKLISSCVERQKQGVTEINEHIKSSLSSMKNVTFIDPNDALCTNGDCLIIYKHNPIYLDGSHLSVFGADYVMQYILSFI